ncbi:MAG: hypothetical protein ACTS1X_01735 [Parasphingopyxis sp.]|uniref:hypothetical protein n=1 Tax=Parasphingopyxis sp. TaxID=1920299 RepID=UPI003FA0A397
MFADIRALFEEIKLIAEAFNGLETLEPAEKARELIRLRRDYSEKNARVATLVEAQICGPLESRADAQPLLRRYRETVNEARGAVAEHQANWPATKIDTDPDSYHLSVHRISEMQSAHLAWKIDTFLPEAERLLRAAAA